MAESYDGARIRVHFDGDRCIHSRNCVLGLPGVFRANVEGPWIDPDGADVEELAALIRTCPSGALSFERLDGGTAEQTPQKNVVRVLENGPLAIRAAATAWGQPAVRLTLCRCGQSKNKPFCDGSHREAGFTATGEVPAQDVSDLSPVGPVQITSYQDGPLRIDGPVEIVQGTGHPVARRDKCVLCRCGGSSNKPFCDGTHKRNGFSAP